MNAKKLTNDGAVDLINKMAQDYLNFTDSSSVIPNKLIYKYVAMLEEPSIQRSARKAALEVLTTPVKPLMKFAFDTRRFDQETTRNPRTNLQEWVRSDQFIDDDTQSKIDIFAKMIKPLDELKQSFGNQPEWHTSYARTLHESVYRILRVKEADFDIFRPQLAYLEQLMFARYRLSMDELQRLSNVDFKNAILKKDENLLKRGAYLHVTQADEDKQAIGTIIKDSDMQQQSIVNAIFGKNGFRREGEKSVTRTVTIIIKDTVDEDK